MPPTSTDSKYAPTAWGTEYLEDITVPSGQTCQCRRPGMQGLIEKGILDKMDILTAMVNDQHIERVKKGRKPDRVAEIASDPKRLTEVLHAVDRVVEYVVVQPDVRRPVAITKDENGDDIESPLPDEAREPGVVYTDMIDTEDKMFLFNFAVGGTRSVERFRQQSSEALGNVDAVEAVEGASQ